MRELNVNEIKEVSGGLIWIGRFLGGWAGGHALNWMIGQNWGSSRNSWETNIAP